MLKRETSFFTCSTFEEKCKMKILVKLDRCNEDCLEISMDVYGKLGSTTMPPK